MTERRTYRVIAEREPGWWYIRVEDIGHSTQARRLGMVEHMARDLIALAEDVPEDSFDVEVQVRVGDAQVALEEARATRARAEVAQDEASEATRTAVRRLRAIGLPMRDVGELLGMTHQRVSQLADTPGSKR